MAGGVPAGIYQTCSLKVTYIVSHSEAEIVVVEDKDNGKKYQNLRTSKFKYIVTMEDKTQDMEDVTKTLSWKEFDLEQTFQTKVQERLDALTPIVRLLLHQEQQVLPRPLCSVMKI